MQNICQNNIYLSYISQLYHQDLTVLLLCLLSNCLLSLLFVSLDLTELQVAVSDVNTRYEALGGELKDRLARQQASLELRQKAKQGTEELKSWLTDREHSLKQGQTASPSRPEVVRAQAQENKVQNQDWVDLLCSVLLFLGDP